MAYTAWSVVFGEQPTAAKWNQLGTNDAGFKDGTNLDDGILLARHFTDKSIASERLNSTVAFLAWAGAGTSINPSTFTKIAFNTEEFDLGNDFASNTFTAPVAGIYWFGARIDVNTTTSIRSFTTLYKNGSEYIRGNDGLGARGQYVGGIIRLAAGDTVDVYHWNDNGNNSAGGNQYLSWFSGYLIGEV